MSRQDLNKVLIEWQSKTRRMGCVNATNWLCRRVSIFSPLRLTRYTKDGEPFEHVVASNGRITIDLAPYADRPKI
jgi:hypothetical protein